MINQDTFKPRIEHLYIVLLILMGLLSALRFWRIVTVTFSQAGAMDFHSNWYYGHFLRQGQDPFAAYLDQREPAIPIFYIDGKVVASHPIGQKGLTAVPSNTALMLLLLTPFAFLSWTPAKVIWMVINLAIICMLPTLVIRLFRDGSNLHNKYKALIYLASWGFLATSMAAGMGQTTLLVFALMLISVLTADKHWFLAGLALGVALGKYSLSFPFLLFLLFKRRYWVVATAMAVQFLGFMILSLVTKTPLPTLLVEYGKISIGALYSPGVQLLSPANGIVPYLAILLFTPFVFWALSNRLKARKNAAVTEKEIADIHLLIMLTFCTLLTIYHREYDAVVFILLTALIIIGLANHYWELGLRTRVILAASVFTITAILSRPGSWLGSILPGSFSPIGKITVDPRITSFALIIGLFICFWLFFKIRVRDKSFEDDYEALQTAGMETVYRLEPRELAEIEKTLRQEKRLQSAPGE